MLNHIKPSTIQYGVCAISDTGPPPPPLSLWNQFEQSCLNSLIALKKHHFSNTCSLVVNSQISTI